MPFRHQFQILVCTLCTCFTVQAQNETIDLHFISFPKSAEPEPLQLLIGKGETIEVELPTNHVSKAYQVPVLSKWTLGKTTTTEEGKLSFQNFGSTASIKSKSQLVLVLRPDKDKPEDLNLVALDFSEGGFGGGDYLFLNATKVDIAGVVGETKFSVKPSKSKLMAPKATNKKGGRSYTYARFFFRNKETAKGFFSATWRLNEKARSIVIFYHDPGTRQIRLHIIRSFVS